MAIEVRVKGITAKGTQHEENYLLLMEENVFDAMKSAIDYANDEYNVERDENGNVIPNSTYKEFETITSVEVITH